MADGITGKYRCYVCRFCADNATAIIHHTVASHNEAGLQFSIRKAIFDENCGNFIFKSIHYSININELANKITNGFNPFIREEEDKLIFKRKCEKKEQLCSAFVGAEPAFREKNVQTSNSGLYSLIPTVIEKLELAGRLADFESVLKAISEGFMDNNIALHLLLDIGQFYSHSTVTGMKYSAETVQFWSTVKCMFKGKGINFFRGYKAEGLKDNVPIKTSDCKINFIVPSDNSLIKESRKYTDDAKEPGFLRTSLESFSRENSGKDVKISIDGKKLASGFGILGDENLCGYEMPPTLTDRKAQLESEIQNVEDLKTLVEEESIDGRATLSDVDNSMKMKKALLLTMSNLSCRIQELRLLVVKKNIALNNLLKQVEGDWKDSKLAPAISFYKTKIVQSNATIRDLLQSIDDLGCRKQGICDNSSYSL